jgi:transcriptional regulator with XRE-family HTH domain
MATRFGTEMKRLRLEMGFEQKEAAAKAGIDATYWNKLENGIRRPPSPAAKPREAETLIRKISGALRRPNNDPFPTFMALATLPDEMPEAVAIPVRDYFTHKQRGRKRNN